MPQESRGANVQGNSIYKPSLHTKNNHSSATQPRQVPPIVHPGASPAPVDDPNAHSNEAGNGEQRGIVVVDTHGQSEEYPKDISEGRYRLVKKIGEGSFGVIFLAIDRHRTDDRRSRVAVKFESRKCSAPQLRDEYRTYMLLRGVSGVPSVHYYGQEGNFYCLVMDLLGESLEELFDACERRFSVPTVAQLAIQMISLIRSIHERGLIYRDIKPDNFLVGQPGDDRAKVHLIDFGMAKYFRDPKTGTHIPYRERKSLSGTARYMSINTHLGKEQSRRDDLESIGHVLFYFLRGNLPWQGLKAASNKEKYERIGAKKQATHVRELAEGYPWEFGRYLDYCRQLSFEADPDYAFLVNLMRGLTTPRMPLDWIEQPKRSGSPADIVGPMVGAHRTGKPSGGIAAGNPAATTNISARAIINQHLGVPESPPPALRNIECADAKPTAKHRAWYRRLLCLG